VDGLERDHFSLITASQTRTNCQGQTCIISVLHESEKVKSDPVGDYFGNVRLATEAHGNTQKKKLFRVILCVSVAEKKCDIVELATGNIEGK